MRRWEWGWGYYQLGGFPPAISIWHQSETPMGQPRFGRGVAALVWGRGTGHRHKEKIRKHVQIKTFSLFPRTEGQISLGVSN